MCRALLQAHIHPDGPYLYRRQVTPVTLVRQLWARLSSLLVAGMHAGGVGENGKGRNRHRSESLKNESRFMYGMEYSEHGPVTKALMWEGSHL